MTPQQRRTTWTDRIGQFDGGVFKSDQPRNYPLSKSTALCVNTAFAYPYYILPILFPHEKSLGLSPAIFGIMQSVMLRGHRGRRPERRREEQEHPVLWTKEQTGPHDVEPA